MAFADLNNDKYTDVITILDTEKNVFVAHFFDNIKSVFGVKTQVKLSECTKITNIAVGKSIDRIRLFITCSLSNGTAVIFYDKQPKSNDFERATY